MAGFSLIYLEYLARKNTKEMKRAMNRVAERYFLDLRPEKPALALSLTTIATEEKAMMEFLEKQQMVEKKLIQ